MSGLPQPEESNDVHPQLANPNRRRHGGRGGDASVCERLLPPLAETTESLAAVGVGGRFVWVKGAGHDIDLTEPQRIRDTLDEIWDEATG